MNYRIIFSDNGTLNDFSVKLDNYHAGVESFEFVSADDYLYIGSRFPFNSFYLKFGTLNATVSTPSISIWDGNQWRSTVDLVDQTYGMTQSGYISFVPSKERSGWAQDDTVLNNGNEEIMGLGDVTIYDQYWLRLSLTSDLDAGTTLSWIGHILCQDDDLYSEYPLFNSSTMKSAFESGKTDWEEQRVAASNLLISDLISRNIILNQGQILDVSKLKYAAVCKTAQVIFNSMGDDYKDDAQMAKNEYDLRISNGVLNIDLNNNATLDKDEARFRQGYLFR